MGTMMLRVRIPALGELGCGEAPPCHTLEPEFLPSAPSLKLRELPDPTKPPIVIPILMDSSKCPLGCLPMFARRVGVLHVTYAPLEKPCIFWHIKCLKKKKSRNGFQSAESRL